MPFHLAFNPKPSENKITHRQHLLLMGSCFSEHISRKLLSLKFSVTSNPFGIVFNPKSIELFITRIIEKKCFQDHEVLEKNGLYICLESHSSFADTQKKRLLDTLNQAIENWHFKLSTSHWFIITFGSAYAYMHHEQGRIVANCHKLPDNAFTKTRLSVYDLVNDYQTVLDRLRELNPTLQVMFTVSPVKHLRDGVIENNISKAVLLQTVHQLVEANTFCSYFPSYELVNDDLRDYRFYEADMAHPNQQAIDYVWEKFSDVYFNVHTKQLNEKIQEVAVAMNHKPFRQESESFTQFKQLMYRKCQLLNQEEACLDLQSELAYFSN